MNWCLLSLTTTYNAEMIYIYISLPFYTTQCELHRIMTYVELPHHLEYFEVGVNRKEVKAINRRFMSDIEIVVKTIILMLKPTVLNI